MMRAKTIVTFVGLSVFSAFALFACGKSSSPAEKGGHNSTGHDHGGHNHPGNDQAGDDHTAEPVEVAQAHGPASAREPEAEAAAESVDNGFNGMPAPGTKAFCPVMKQNFKVAANSSFSVHEGKTYVFCCPACKEPFEKDPKKYIAN